MIFQQIEGDSIRNINNLKVTMDLTIRQIPPLSIFVINNPYLQNALNEIDDTEIDSKTRINNILKTFITPKTYIEAITVYDTKTKKYYSSSNEIYSSLKMEKHPEELINEFNGYDSGVWGTPFWSDNKSKYMLPYYRLVFDNKTGKKIGLIEFQLSMSSIIETAKNNTTGDDGLLMVIDKNGRIYVHE